MIYPLEEVFRTEGVPEFTFIRPPNFNEIFVDIRTPGKPVIIEGQSGTGKTTTAKKILEECLPDAGFEYLSARRSSDFERIHNLSEGKEIGYFIVDDFHRLSDSVQAKIANLVKMAAEDYDPKKYPKIVIIGINRVGSALIHLVHDIAKRCGIHRIRPASAEMINDLIRKGEEKLNIVIDDKASVYSETQGDYWLTQLICQSVCLLNDVMQTHTGVPRQLAFSLGTLRARAILRLENSYHETVTEFSRGKRFRSTNDPYFKLLKAISSQDSSIVDLTELANAVPDVRGSINNIKEKRLSVLISSKPICDRYFFYNPETKHFAIEDPALFYYIRHLDWDALRKACGFRVEERTYEFDIAISFAGENRPLAKQISDQLETMDCAVFFDELYEANYLGKAWSAKFKDIFANQSRLVLCLLDEHHLAKIWPTFEREAFAPRVAEEAVIPIFLDESIFPGIPRDTIGIMFKPSSIPHDQLPNRIFDDIVFKVMSRLEED